MSATTSQTTKLRGGRIASALKNIALAVGTLIVVDVLGAQILKTVLPSWESLRVPSEIYNHDFTKMADAVTLWGPYRYRTRTNSLGFKDAANRTVPLESDRRRVVLIGDSFTEGIGYEFDDTFAGILAKELAKHEVEILNAGVAAYATPMYYRKTKYLLEDVGLKFNELVVFIDMSDIQEAAQLYFIDESDRVQTEYDDFESIRWFGNFTKAQKLKNFLKTNSMVVRALDMGKDYFTSDWSPESSPTLGDSRALWAVEEELFDKFGREGIERAQENMDRLASVLREHEVALTIVVYPWPDQVARHDLESKQVTYWREWARKNDVRFVNLFPPFLEGDPKDVLARYYIPGDFHFNEAGNRLIASEFLKRCDLTQ